MREFSAFLKYLELKLPDCVKVFAILAGYVSRRGVVCAIVMTDGGQVDCFVSSDFPLRLHRWYSLHLSFNVLLCLSSLCMYMCVHVQMMMHKLEEDDDSEDEDQADAFLGRRKRKKKKKKKRYKRGVDKAKQIVRRSRQAKGDEPPEMSLNVSTTDFLQLTVTKTSIQVLQLLAEVSGIG